MRILSVSDKKGGLFLHFSLEEDIVILPVGAVVAVYYHDDKKHYFKITESFSYETTEGDMHRERTAVEIGLRSNLLRGKHGLEDLIYCRLHVVEDQEEIDTVERQNMFL